MHWRHGLSVSAIFLPFPYVLSPTTQSKEGRNKAKLNRFRMEIQNKNQQQK